MELPQLDKIQILLHEYDGLRGEIIQRWVGAQQQISIGVLVLIGVITILFSTKKIKHPQDYFLYGLLGFAVCIFGYAMFQWGRDTNKAAARVREIEAQVNQLAGEELLQWETRWAGAVTGYFGLGRPFTKPTGGQNKSD